MQDITYNLFHQKNKRVQESVVGDNNFTYRYIIELIRHYLGNSGYLLDVGCGVGTIDFYVANKGITVDGIDISSRAISLANSSKKAMCVDNVNFYNKDVSSGFDKNKYDYVFCIEVLEHVIDDRMLVRMLYAALKKGGLAIISVPLITAPLYRAGILKGFDNKVGHLRRYDVVPLKDMFEVAGFHVEEIRLVEGILRNLLFTVGSVGILLKFVRWPVSIVVNIIDDFLIRIFGASGVYIVLRK